MKKEKKPRLVVLLGPTAVGKTALSLSLARLLGTEIISGDSRLVYRGFDLGTAKPTPRERQLVKHHLIDIRAPGQGYSVQEFQQEAGRLIGSLWAAGKLPLIVGGTGLYLQSLVEGYAFGQQGGDAAYREKLRRLAAEKGREAVHALLQKTDPELAAQIHPHNFHRVVRALEAQELGGETLSRAKREPPYCAYVIGLTRPRAELYARINLRVEQMWAAGLAEEVQGLLASGVSRAAQAMQGIGYRQTAAYLAGEMTEAAAIRAIQAATRHFAKRQLTWFRRMGYIHWFDLSGRDEAATCKAILWNLRQAKGFWPVSAE